MKRTSAFALIFSICSTALLADQSQVIDARAVANGETWRIDVTISHPDTGWDHYADGWAVLSEDGAELGYRKLHHPHETEQPFTRSLSGLSIPEGAGSVFIRAHDSVHGWSDARFELKLP